MGMWEQSSRSGLTLCSPGCSQQTENVFYLCTFACPSAFWSPFQGQIVP